MEIIKLLTIKRELLQLKKQENVYLTITEKEELLQTSKILPTTIFNKDKKREYIVKARCIFRK